MYASWVPSFTRSSCESIGEGAQESMSTSPGGVEADQAGKFAATVFSGATDQYQWRIPRGRPTPCSKAASLPETFTESPTHAPNSVCAAGGGASTVVGVAVGVGVG